MKMQLHLVYYLAQTIFLPTLLALLIPNTTANHAITYTYTNSPKSSSKSQFMQMQSM